MATYVKRLGSNPAAKKGGKVSHIPLRWTEAEKEQIARDSLQAMRDDSGLTRVDAVRRAVNQMLPKRRKYVKDIAHDAPWIVALWDKIAAQKDALNAAQGLFETPTPEAVSELVATPSEAADGPESTREETPQDRMARARAVLAAKVAAGEAAFIRWTQSEKRAIAKEFVRLRDAADDEARAKGWFNVETARRAVENVMPDSRKRAIRAFSNVQDWLEPLIAEVEAEIRAEAEEQARLEQEALELEMRERAEREAAEFAEKERQRVEAEAAEAANAKATMQRVIDEAAERERDAGRQAVDEFKQYASLDDLLGLVARRFARAVIPAFVDELRGAMGGILSEGREAARAVRNEAAHVQAGNFSYVQPPKAPERVKLPKVFIYGFYAKLAQEIEREYQGRLDIIHGAPQEGGAGPRKAAGCDVTVICTDRVGHAQEYEIKAQAREYAKVSGGKTSVTRWLDDYLAKQSGGAQPATH